MCFLAIVFCKLIINECNMNQDNISLVSAEENAANILVGLANYFKPKESQKPKEPIICIDLTLDDSTDSEVESVQHEHTAASNVDKRKTALQPQASVLVISDSEVECVQPEPNTAVSNVEKHKTSPQPQASAVVVEAQSKQEVEGESSPAKLRRHASKRPLQKKKLRKKRAVAKEPMLDTVVVSTAESAIGIFPIKKRRRIQPVGRKSAKPTIRKCSRSVIEDEIDGFLFQSSKSKF